MLIGPVVNTARELLDLSACRGAGLLDLGDVATRLGCFGDFELCGDCVLVGLVVVTAR